MKLSDLEDKDRLWRASNEQRLHPGGSDKSVREERDNNQSLTAGGDKETEKIRD